MADMGRDPLTIPEPGDPDRKRALNVLAQRRYRQRRREKIRALEKKVQSSNEAASPSVTSSSSEYSSHNSSDVPATQLGGFHPRESLGPCQTSEMGLFDNIPNDLSLDLESFLLPGSFSTPPADISMLDSSSSSSIDSYLSISFPPTTTSQTTPPVPLSEELQTLEASQFTFPDDTLMPIHELAVMHAGLNIAQLLGCVESMWDLTNLRTFTRTSIPTTNIPSNLEPTEAQRLIPHHPLFDIFPWPSVRTRIICIFAQPIHTRPPSARDPEALMKMFYDMDDPAEGLRVTGQDWYDGDNWEIGQVFFKNWWWAFDRNVIRNSNALRKRRGAGLLTMGTS